MNSLLFMALSSAWVPTDAELLDSAIDRLDLRVRNLHRVTGRDGLRFSDRSLPAYWTDCAMGAHDHTEAAGGGRRRQRQPRCCTLSQFVAWHQGAKARRVVLFSVVVISIVKVQTGERNVLIHPLEHIEGA